MKTASALLSGLVISTLLAGCSETQFADWMGAGKNAPDESSVRVNQSLAMPPDLQLRPPSSTTLEEDGSLNTTAAASQAAAVPNPQVASTTAATPPAPTAAVPQQDVYAKYGISKTNPDGTPKDQQLLWKELKAAQLAEKRRANPNYGTIMNIGEIFSDD